MKSAPSLSSTRQVHFDHPVDDAVRQRILEQLSELEQRHRVRVLFACESGSRAWGFASPDSDYDVRFIYVHEPSWYLSVDPQRDVIECPIDDELDVSGWELRKALSLLRRANPVLLEWLSSPIVYRQDPDFIARLGHVVDRCFSPLRGRHHYLAMAKKNFRGYLQGETVRLKKYLYVLRPLLAARWIDSGRGVPPMRFADLAEAMLDDQALLAEINRLLEIKMRSGEAEYAPRFERLHGFIRRELEVAATREALSERPDGDQGLLDQLLYQTVLRTQPC
ncbi:nucleotidyltransferase domain-containing protein [Chitinimonas lacunae]|uniref:Nucleotidyltransferase domain-containing protein n=1 Tax=Chitinimonas lacunae TaxID=1963018 RepID=A0ABV8MTC1_9NEIS